VILIIPVSVCHQVSTTIKQARRSRSRASTLPCTTRKGTRSAAAEAGIPSSRRPWPAAVAGRADPTTGQAIVAFVSLKDGDEGSVEMLEELREHVAKKIGKIARPANIVLTPELPKTRSGKIMRRLLRDVAEHRALGDTTTLADPTVVSELEERATSERRRGITTTRTGVPAWARRFRLPD